MLEFGQGWAKLGLRKLGTTLGEMVRLHNCAVADKGSINDGQSRDYKNRIQLQERS